MCLRQGAWHLTYVRQGPAVVANIYTEAARPRQGKYFSGPTVRVGLRRCAGEIIAFAAQPTSAIAWRLAPRSQDMTGGFADLEEMLTSATVTDLLKDPQLRCQASVLAEPGGDGSPIQE